MDFSSVCRTCLSGNPLNPLFKEKDDHDMFSKALYMATGVRIQYKDNLPQNMCANCIIKLNNTFKFRRQCSDVEKKLLLEVKKQSNCTIKDREIDDNSFNNHYSDDSMNMDDKNIDTIKVENNFLNNYDIEDDIPLNLLANLQATEIKTSLKNEKYESTPDLNTATITDNNLKLNVEIIKHEKLEHINISSMKSIQTTTTIINNENDPKMLIDNLTSTQNTNTKSKPDITDRLYEVIMDSITQKSTRVLCMLCNKEFSIRSIDIHMSKLHPGADKRKVQCEMCDRYVLKGKLNRHILLMHGSGNIVCGYCKKEFISKEELIKHVATCSEKRRKRKINETGRELRECDECHKVMQKASLRMHKAVKHAGMKPVCEHCGKSFGNKFRLSEHYRAKHGYEKFRCNHCDFRSASAMAMKNHERRHRDEKPFVCEECGAKFHAAYLLAQHKQSHRKEKTIKCDLCPSTFKANNSLHMHKLTCHSNTTYKCNICNRSYKCRHYAVKHIRHVHRYTGDNPPLTVMNNRHVEKNGEK